MQILCSKTWKMHESKRIHKSMKIYLKFNSSYFYHPEMVITIKILLIVLVIFSLKYVCIHIV